MSEDNPHQKALTKLLEFSPPRQLQRSLQSMFYAYLLDADDTKPVNYKPVIEDQFILMKFLEKLEDTKG